MLGLGAPELVLIILAILLLFGYKKLPDAARSWTRPRPRRPAPRRLENGGRPRTDHHAGPTPSAQPHGSEGPPA